MRIIKIKSFSLIIFLTLFPFFTVSFGIVDAKTQYVSDQLLITMREGKGNEYKIIKMLTAGTPLEIIQEGPNYLKVRTQDGQEGWVLTQYITPETPKTEIIARLEKEVDQFKKTLEQYEGEKDSLQDQLKTAKVERSKTVVELTNERDRLKTLNDRLSTEAEHLRKENSLLKRLQILWWFLAGGGVFFVGWITGRVSRKKRYY